MPTCTCKAVKESNASSGEQKIVDLLDRLQRLLYPSPLTQNGEKSHCAGSSSCRNGSCKMSDAPPPTRAHSWDFSPFLSHLLKRAPTNRPSIPPSPHSWPPFSSSLPAPSPPASGRLCGRLRLPRPHPCGSRALATCSPRRDGVPRWDPGPPPTPPEQSSHRVGAHRRKSDK
jgi:hypothetical protein